MELEFFLELAARVNGNDPTLQVILRAIERQFLKSVALYSLFITAFDLLPTALGSLFGCAKAVKSHDGSIGKTLNMMFVESC